MSLHLLLLLMIDDGWLQVLVAGVMDRLEPSFRAMSHTNWAGSSMVGEESPYIGQFSTILVS